MRVDDTPPVVSFSGGEGDLLNAVRDSNNNWTVHLSGTASDPVLKNTSTPGSGVPADGVFVTLYKADGGLAGAARQAATLAGGAWTVDYVLSDSEPSGCYTAEASGGGRPGCALSRTRRPITPGRPRGASASARPAPQCRSTARS